MLISGNFDQGDEMADRKTDKKKDTSIKRQNYLF